MSDTFSDLPVLRVKPVPLPEGHPDLDTFDADMRAIAKLGRHLWTKALRNDAQPDMPEPLCDEAELERLNLSLNLSVALFAAISHDIAAMAVA